MSDTPLTDKFGCGPCSGDLVESWAAFARGLERENAKLRERVATLEALVECGKNAVEHYRAILS